MRDKILNTFTAIILLLTLAFVANLVYTTSIHKGYHGDHYGNEQLAQQDNCWLYKTN